MLMPDRDESSMQQSSTTADFTDEDIHREAVKSVRDWPDWLREEAARETERSKEEGEAIRRT